MLLKIMDGSAKTLSTLEVTYTEIGVKYYHIESIDGVRYTGAGDSYWKVWTERTSSKSKTIIIHNWVAFYFYLTSK